MSIAGGCHEITLLCMISFVLPHNETIFSIKYMAVFKNETIQTGIHNESIQQYYRVLMQICTASSKCFIAKCSSALYRIICHSENSQEA